MGTTGAEREREREREKETTLATSVRGDMESANRS
jgi:hypothetical protein